jgi:hypothetical protein
MAGKGVAAKRTMTSKSAMAATPPQPCAIHLVFHRMNVSPLPSCDAWQPSLQGLRTGNDRRRARPAGDLRPGSSVSAAKSSA